MQTTTLRRRLITIPGYLVAWLLWLGAAPLWLPLAAVVDLSRRSPGAALRCGAFIFAYLSCELAGMVASGGFWLWKGVFRVDPERWVDRHYRLQAWWGATLFGAVVRLFGLRVEVDGDADLGRGPYLLLLRHASSGDTLLASALVSRPHRLRLRYVLKRELLWDPSIDIVGNRLPNVFVDRSSDDTEREAHRVQELARDLGPRDGIVIYPEGTRFSYAKQQRVLDRFRQKGDVAMLEYARSLACVLPPRPRGTLGLLDAAPQADVVTCAHTGFEGSASLAQIWVGALVHQVIRIQFRRIPRAEIPTASEEQLAWILEEWRKVGAWVEGHQTAANGAAAQTQP
jgi:1-acyl-sn-glycerol-3-phosphate acyltransferase